MGATQAVAVIVQDGRVLLVRRRADDGAPPWALPGGKLEPGEYPEDASATEAPFFNGSGGLVLSVPASCHLPRPGALLVQADPLSSGRQGASGRASRTRRSQSDINCGYQVVVPFRLASHADRVRANDQAAAAYPPRNDPWHRPPGRRRRAAAIDQLLARDGPRISETQQLQKSAVITLLTLAELAINPEV